MTAFVVLAAGLGTRVGRVGGELHKALLPIGEKAALSRLIALSPHDSRLIICVGHKAEQIKRFMRMAHPDLDVTYVDVDIYAPHAGPAATLCAAADAVGDDDMIFTSCDTLWEEIPWTRYNHKSWAAVASMPAGTHAERWCRIRSLNGIVDVIADKRYTVQTIENEGDWSVYTGMAFIRREDLQEFWLGFMRPNEVRGETQVSAGFAALLAAKKLHVNRIHWTDIGDAVAYRSAVAQHVGYDWVKPGQATYISSGRVTKYNADATAIANRRARGELLRGIVPELIDADADFLTYQYINGCSVYEAIQYWGTSIIDQVMRWYGTWSQRTCQFARDNGAWQDASKRFYERKTYDRISMLRPVMIKSTVDAVNRINWDRLHQGVIPGVWHGDLNFGNIIYGADNTLYGIDWREDFAGETTWGDQRYDMAKLLAGTRVHWDNARRGDFRPWDVRDYAAEAIHTHIDVTWDIEVIGALSLLNSAPLHGAPLDEILVARGVAWLEEIL